MSSIKVTLGPNTYLHRGYHGALLECPPPSVEYSLSNPTVVFESYARTTDFHPSKHFAIRESHFYEEKPGFVHSVHFPVANKDATWILDTDSLLVHLQYGNVVWNPQLETWARDDRGRRLVAERSGNMLELIASPRCVALCFHCRGQLERNREQCLALLSREWNSLVVDIFKKAEVCYPAQPPRLSRSELRSRNSQGRRGIVFAASGFEEKGGAVTLELYRRLLHRRDVELCYIGPLPPLKRVEYEDVLSTALYAPEVPRSLLLDVFREAHILVAPSRHEALGITLLEALSCGLAIVTTSGPGMENVHEVVHEGAGGLLVAKSSVNGDPPVEKLCDAVVSLLENPKLYQGMSEYNLSLITDGIFSVGQRDKTLLGLYGVSGRHTATASACSPSFRPEAHEDHADQPERYEWRSSAVTSARHELLRQHFPDTKTGFLVPGIALGEGIASLGNLSTNEKQLFSNIGSANTDCDADLNSSHHRQVGET
jgi:glycosyltransferase involved in cell wall biosynthesis